MRYEKEEGKHHLILDFFIGVLHQSSTETLRKMALGFLVFLPALLLAPYAEGKSSYKTRSFHKGS